MLYDLTLFLLMPLVFANDPDHAFPTDQFALGAYLFD
jgi:hypothetical protein